GVQGLGVIDDAAEVVQGGLGQAGVAVAGELVDAAFPEGLVHVHAGTVVADDGLGHEGGGLAVGVGHVVDAVLEDLDFVRLLHPGVELDTDFALASVGHFVVVYLDVEAHLLHGATHGGAQVVEGVDRRDGGVATLDPGAVAQVAVDELLAGGPGGFLGGNFHEGAGHVGTEVYFVKDEELGLGAEERGIPKAGGFQVLLGALGDGAGVAVVALHGGGIDDVAPQDDGGLVKEGVDDGGVIVGHQDHVRLIDALPAGDGGAVEHLAGGEEVLVHIARGDGDVVLLALGVGEAQVHPAGLVIFDQRQRFVRHVFSPK